jgi:ATP-dependent DNA helicase PIF1
MIGYWLGDGSKSIPMITTQESAVINYFQHNLPKYKCYLQYHNAYNYRINGDGTNLKYSNYFSKVLRDLNLLNNKHIPHIYNCNSRENRLKLLAGILDADGHLIKDGGFEFTQSIEHEQIMDDVIYLCRSLGFACYKQKKHTSWTYKDVKKYGEAWRISINGKGIEEIPTLSPRKQSNPRKQIKDVLVSGITLEKLESQDYYGFCLDGNHRYLMDNFIVTHNSGKSFCIKYLIKKLNEKYDNPDAIGVTAMTGVAAVLLGATTINSFLKIGLAKDSAEDLYERIVKSRRDRAKYNILSKELKVLIIDEVSMMNAKLFGKISDYFKYLRRCDLPFGGIQIILSGDFCQLAPVQLQSGYLFQSDEWKEMDMHIIEFTKCFRQSKDLEFQEILSKIRFGNIDNKSYMKLQTLDNSRFKDSGVLPTKLFPTNKEVDVCNDTCLTKLCKDTNQILIEFKIKQVSLDTKKIKDVIELNGIPNSVFLAIGAQVMITFNINIESELVNGTRGVIVNITNNLITIKKLDNSLHTISYIAAYDPEDKNKDHPKSIFEYMPLKIAYATSIHKGQGSTIEFLEVDLSKSFGYGMGYVALSRAVSLDRLIITGLTKHAFRCCPVVKQFYKNLKYS